MTKPLMPEQFGKIFDVSRETLQKLELYAQLLVKWSVVLSF